MEGDGRGERAEVSQRLSKFGKTCVRCWEVQFRGGFGQGMPSGRVAGSEPKKSQLRRTVQKLQQKASFGVFRRNGLGEG